MTSGTLSAQSFERFVLKKIAQCPSLISETPSSVEVSSNSLTVTKEQRLVIAASSSNDPSQTESAGSTSRPAINALLLRSIVDAPLLPLGGEHLLYEVILPAFVAASAASKELYDAQHAPVPTQSEEASPSEIETHKEELRAHQQRLTIAAKTAESTKHDLVQSIAKTRRLMASIDTFHQRSLVGEECADAASRKRPRD